MACGTVRRLPDVCNFAIDPRLADSAAAAAAAADHFPLPRCLCVIWPVAAARTVAYQRCPSPSHMHTNGKGVPAFPDVWGRPLAFAGGPCVRGRRPIVCDCQHLTWWLL
eukprot:GHVT01097576.1.p2 GENE.GHVT01097576.1~~GHVT01097576.1.p2  ORF type:complete len:109 (+),score=20.64 GHVT01097576.1:778-1104(+)